MLASLATGLGGTVLYDFGSGELPVILLAGCDPSNEVPHMNRTAVVAATFALLVGAACGGSKSCQDACNAVQACATKLGAQAINVTACVQSCTAGTCQNKQAAVDCVSNLSCPTTVDAYNAGLTNCQNTTQCAITFE